MKSMPAATAPTGGSLGAAQQRLAATCAEADRLSAIADEEARLLREARRARAAFERESENGLALADPRNLTGQKLAALASYRERVHRATEREVVIAGTAEYLAEIDRLNRVARTVAGKSGEWTRRVRELDERVNRLAMTAEAARVAAAAARDECTEARRALVRQDERLALDGAPAFDEADQPPGAWDDTITPIEALLQGDRAVFRALVARLAEDIGLDARRLQLLLLELREALVERARASAILDFAPGNPFWGQLSLAEARAVAASLEVMGLGFDGRGGWRDGRPAEPRELAIAISMAGLDPRLLRVRPSRAELAGLWAGTVVAPVEYVRERSPDLALETFEPLLGEHADGLGELWDNWGRLRRLMLSPDLVSRASPA
ncbi:MAG TPA: hypothetical protein VH741_04395 [Candidatus Limnocylindrales bacterium]